LGFRTTNQLGYEDSEILGILGGEGNISISFLDKNKKQASNEIASKKKWEEKAPWGE